MNNYQETVNSFLQVDPKAVEGVNNTSYFFYCHILFQVLMSVFEIENAPDSWDTQYLLERLFKQGFVCVTEDKGVNYALECGITGYNAYLRPTKCIIANPVLGRLERTIGVDCELIYMIMLDNYFYNTNDLIKRYAVLLAQCDGTLNTTLINSRVAHVFEADSKSELKTLQKIYDDVTNGKPAIFHNKTGGEFERNHSYLNVKNTFIGNEILDVKRTIMNEFLTEIGINNANTDKKERLITDEVNANKEEIKTIVSVWLDQLTKCFDKINEMFDLNVSIKLRDYGGEDNANTNQRMAMDGQNTI